MTELNAAHETILALLRERAYQNRKYGTPDQRQLSIGDYLVILRKELEEAEFAFVTNERDHALAEILQVAAVAVACMERHGCGERPETERASQ